MIALVLSMLVITALAVGTVGLVYVGMEGRGRERVPRLADRMARAARHMNGDGTPPRSFSRLLG